MIDQLKIHVLDQEADSAICSVYVANNFSQSIHERFNVECYAAVDWPEKDVYLVKMARLEDAAKKLEREITWIQ